MGEGIVIWWPAFDSNRFGHFNGCHLETQEAWDILVHFWYDILFTNAATVHLEWKPSVPGRDYINSIGRALRFAHQVNDLLGRKAMVINNEWAHLLIGGTTVTQGTKMTIESGLFDGFFHANSAELAEFEVNDATGQVVRGTPGDDADWFVGCGDEDTWQDQQRACGIMSKMWHGDIIAEHDLNPAGDDPFEYYAKSRENLEGMFKAVGYQPPE